MSKVVKVSTLTSTFTCTLVPYTRFSRTRLHASPEIFYPSPEFYAHLIRRRPQSIEAATSVPRIARRWLPRIAVSKHRLEKRIMPKLLELPNELVTEIVHLVLCTSSISIPTDTKRYRVTGREYSTRICYIPSKEAYRPNALDLLLTCRKLHTLTMDYLLRTPQTWKLDIIIINDHWLFPTWRYIAPRASVRDGIERLEINIIPCFTQDERAMTTTWLAIDLFGMRKPQCMNHLRGYLTYALASGYKDLTGNHIGNPIHCHRGARLVRDWTMVVSGAYYGSGNDTLSLNEVPVRRIDGLAHLDLDPLYPIDSATCNRFRDIVHSFQM
jgi:hypothetical protein